MMNGLWHKLLKFLETVLYDSDRTMRLLATILVGTVSFFVIMTAING